MVTLLFQYNSLGGARVGAGGDGAERERECEAADRVWGGLACIANRGGPLALKNVHC